jgi:hypothetical protein
LTERKTKISIALSSGKNDQVHLRRTQRGKNSNCWRRRMKTGE